MLNLVKPQRFRPLILLRVLEVGEEILPPWSAVAPELLFEIFETVVLTVSPGETAPAASIPPLVTLLRPLTEPYGVEPDLMVQVNPCIIEGAPWR